MPNLRVEIRGDVEFRAALGRLSPRQNPEPFRRALLRAALAIQAKATTLYILSGGSGPPDPTRLTSRTGTLRRSIGVDRSGLGGLVVGVGSDLVYARVHELGGRFVRARPFLEPAATDVLPDLPALFADEWQRSVGSGSAP